MRLTLRLVRAVMFLSLLPQPAVTEESGITTRQADDILNEIRQIRKLLQARQPDAVSRVMEPELVPTKLSLTGTVSIGSEDAPLTMVEFTDYQCPFCQRFHLSTFPEIKRNYIDTAKLRFYSRDLPLSFHSNAMQAALAGRCAGEQGKFWKMREIMISNTDRLDVSNLLAYARELKMNEVAFRICVQSGKYKGAVQADAIEGMNIGASGTPAFVIGKSTPEGVDGELIVGSMPYELFAQKFREYEVR